MEMIRKYLGYNQSWTPSMKYSFSSFNITWSNLTSTSPPRHQELVRKYLFIQNRRYILAA